MKRNATILSCGLLLEIRSLKSYQWVQEPTLSSALTKSEPQDLPVVSVMFSVQCIWCVRTRVGALQLDGDLDGVLRPQQVEHRLQVVPDVSCNECQEPFSVYDTSNT